MAPTTHSNLAAARLTSTQCDPAPVVNTFTSFSQCCASMHGTAQSISQLINHDHPETPTQTPAGGPPDDEDPDDDDDGTLGGNLPDDFRDDPDNGPDNNENDVPDNNNGLNPQDHIFLWLSEAIDNLAHNSRCAMSSEDSRVKV
ncbi:uncharacterized protein EDB91DRAFT_1254359 [Suillus paluster]|uniref:uncharacterized protein n=1 Tax=Suillus paluster TaxID=48578 RepID=UPI001B86A531|nr:uncharacterized protein EDB91DRAFT_1254359 [Suillus paluster]KAG1726345.1 hypothetical protein EDB91DRAFT_1254359 [Suillus paluster]